MMALVKLIILLMISVFMSGCKQPPKYYWHCEQRDKDGCLIEVCKLRDGGCHSAACPVYKVKARALYGDCKGVMNDEV